MIEDKTRKIRKCIENLCVVAVTCMTTQIKGPEQLNNLILNRANYHMVCGLNYRHHPEQGWRLLQSLLVHPQLTKDRVIDIMLNLQIEVSGKNEPRLARVILCQQRIVAIKLLQVPSKSTLTLPIFIAQAIGQKSCQVGNFFIIFPNTKVAPLFQSEINKELLLKYHNLGCEIFAVTDDLSLEKKPLDNCYVQRLKTFCNAKKRAILYCSPLGAPSPTELYAGRSFIQLFSKMEMSEVSIYEPSQVIFSALDLNQIKANANYSQLSVGEISISPVECNYRLARDNFPKMGFQKSLRGNEPMVNREIPKYYFWYLYRHHNKSTPFIISALPTSHNVSVLLLVDKIATEISSKKIPSMVSNTYGDIVKSMLIVYDYSLNTDFNNKKMEPLCRIWEALEGNIFEAPCKLTTSDQLCDFFLDIFKNKSSEQLYYFYVEGKLQIDAVQLFARHRFNVEKVTDLAKKCDCSKMFSNIRALCHGITVERPDAREIKQGLNKRKREITDTPALSQGSQKTNLAFRKQLRAQLTRENLDEIKPINGNLQIIAQNMQMIIDSESTGSRDISERIKNIQVFKQCKFYACHSCRHNFPLPCGEICKCNTYFCYECLSKNSQVSVANGCPICRNTCRCSNCQKTREKLVRSCFTQNCHSCNKAKSYLILCSKIVCNKAFCQECFKCYSQGPPTTNILMLTKWICFACYGHCTCITCKGSVILPERNEETNQKYLDRLLANTSKSQIQATEQPTQSPTILTPAPATQKPPTQILLHPCLAQPTTTTSSQPPSTPTSQLVSKYSKKDDQLQSLELNHKNSIQINPTQEQSGRKATSTFDEDRGRKQSETKQIKWPRQQPKPSQNRRHSRSRSRDKKRSRRSRSRSRQAERNRRQSSNQSNRSSKVQRYTIDWQDAQKPNKRANMEKRNSYSEKPAPAAAQSKPKQSEGELLIPVNRVSSYNFDY